MREVKSFFIQDNSLNKGYTKLNDDENTYNKKLHQNMPPVDVISAYEKLYPGTLAKLLEALDKEQNHIHSRDNVVNKMQTKAFALGRLFGLLSILIIGYVVLSLASNGMLVGGLIFALIAFLGIFGVSFISAKRPFRRNSYDGNGFRRKHKHNFNRDRALDSDVKPLSNETLEQGLKSRRNNKRYNIRRK